MELSAYNSLFEIAATFSIALTGFPTVQQTLGRRFQNERAKLERLFKQCNGRAASILRMCEHMKRQVERRALIEDARNELIGDIESASKIYQDYRTTRLTPTHLRDPKQEKAFAMMLATRLGLFCCLFSIMTLAFAGLENNNNFATSWFGWQVNNDTPYVIMANFEWLTALAFILFLLVRNIEYVRSQIREWQIGTVFILFFIILLLSITCHQLDWGFSVRYTTTILCGLVLASMPLIALWIRYEFHLRRRVRRVEKDLNGFMERFNALQSRFSRTLLP